MNIIYNKDNQLILNGDYFDFAKMMNLQKNKVDIVLTSPPYNTARSCKTKRSLDNYENRYDIYMDNMSEEEYISWSVKLFNSYDSILNKNGVILYNISYGNENPNQLWLTIGDIIKNTNFMVSDSIIWKKSNALPNNVSPNKLTRITEFIFVFCRKNEYKTYNVNKKVKSQSKTGQNYYENIYNYIEAKNNDGACSLNKATYSSELCEKLLSIYAKPNSIILDSFAVTGTTAVACKNMNLKSINVELSNEQCNYAKERLDNM